ncbi:WD40/YVTN/BNR-like repeat-containing protein [Marinobacterium aestuariivivens]|uniref:WD40/YVTN/BNR-like repeat-containing protein n=1 Tax=Marinobacterium aestuariivivens TaxID=1698799 RepID=A0ABW2A407_9GAMM
MKKQQRGIPILRLLALLLPLAATGAEANSDFLEQPSKASGHAARSLLLDVTRAGERLVAVGERGHVLYSDDQGRQWQQAQTPAIVTLTAVYFPTPEHGWAVGHDGLVLHSSDGGRRWQKQLDGFEANRLVRQRLESGIESVQRELATAGPERQEDLQQRLEELQFRLEDAEIAVDEGATKPFLDVWFENEREGFIVGAYGLFFRTEDGGNSWMPWFEHIDNAFGYHYNAITESGSSLLLAGEAGTLYRSRDAGRSWETLASPYEGSWFGLTTCTDSDTTLLYGLRGNLYRSTDQGESWQKVPLGDPVTLSGGSCRGNEAVLTSSAGLVFESLDGGASFRQSSQDRIPYSAASQTDDGRVILVGLGGARAIPNPTSEAKAKP